MKLILMKILKFFMCPHEITFFCVHVHKNKKTDENNMAHENKCHAGSYFRVPVWHTKIILFVGHVSAHENTYFHGPRRLPAWHTKICHGPGLFSWALFISQPRKILVFLFSGFIIS